MLKTLLVPPVTHPVQLAGGPLHGIIYWTPPGRRQICSPSLDHPFKVGKNPGMEAVYEIAGDTADFVGLREAIWEHPTASLT